MSARSLPPELWNTIAQRCRRRDLRSLAIASTLLLSATRPILFQKVVIEQPPDDSSKSATLQLLQTNDALCAAIKSIKLVTHTPDEIGWTSAELFTRFIHADSIALEGWPFAEGDKDEEEAFLEVMCSGQWKSFAYKEVYGGGPTFARLTVEDFSFDEMGWGEITGLERITFESGDTLEHSSMFLRGSAPSIKRLTLPRDTNIVYDETLESMLNDGLRFPNLEIFESKKHFSLDEEDEFMSETMAECITLFLSRHPTIRHLRISCNPYWASYPTFDIPASDFLPLLEKVELPIDTIGLMVKQRLKCLSTLEEVITGDWEFLGPRYPGGGYSDDRIQSFIYEILQNMDRFLNALVHDGGLPAVKRFTITVGPKLDTITYSRITVEQMQLMAKALPVVEEWTGNGNGLNGATDQELAQMFESFPPTLKRIRLRGMKVDQGAMRAIARAVPTLERFCFDNPDDLRDDEWLTFDIVRSTSSDIEFAEGSLTESETW